MVQPPDRPAVGPSSASVCQRNMNASAEVFFNESGELTDGDVVRSNPRFTCTRMVIRSSRQKFRVALCGCLGLSPSGLTVVRIEPVSRRYDCNRAVASPSQVSGSLRPETLPRKRL